ncbi:MAG: DUF4037 domain-containing protein [Anaerolineae bacterium]|nr:DUF4037 domain-containing protein [Anaerolineae bacterium]
MRSTDQHIAIARFLTDQYQRLPQVEAVGVSGSLVSGLGSETSDIDLYIFVSAPIPVEERQRIASLRGYTQGDFGLDYWDPGDEWFDAPTGIEVDEMFWDIAWLTEQVSKVLDRHEASTGYTTCHWHTVRQMSILFDRNERLTALKAKAQADYPEELRRNILQKNYPLLHRIIPAYTNQLRKAVHRKDLVSVNHRFTEYLASYFDLLFALNRIPHPGEKRLLSFAVNHCSLLPDGFEADLTTLLAYNGAADEQWLQTLEHFNQALDALLAVHGF